MGIEKSKVGTMKREPIKEAKEAKEAKEVKIVKAELIPIARPDTLSNWLNRSFLCQKQKNKVLSN
jgi:hypothetical protein